MQTSKHMHIVFIHSFEHARWETERERETVNVFHGCPCPKWDWLPILVTVIDLFLKLYHTFLQYGTTRGSHRITFTTFNYSNCVPTDASTTQHAKFKTLRTTRCQSFFSIKHGIIGVQSGVPNVDPYPGLLSHGEYAKSSKSLDQVFSKPYWLGNPHDFKEPHIGINQQGYEHSLYPMKFHWIST